MSDLSTTMVPVIDTGIGRSQGYASDREWMEAVQRELDALPAPLRQMLEDAERAFTEGVLGL